jgi:CMP-N-acetylneuraminic acid synthetase
MMEQFRHKLKEVESLGQEELNQDLETPDNTTLADNVVVVIPARGDSKRLKKKNIFPLLGKPLLAWSIEAAKSSKYVKTVYVSTEDEDIKNVAEEWGAVVINRPLKLSEGLVYKQDAICHAVREISKEGPKPSLVVSLQANSPEVKTEHIDEGIEFLITKNKQEVMSVDSDLCQNAALRIMTYNAVFQKTLSTNFGVYVADLYDVHFLEDIHHIEKRMKEAQVILDNEVKIDAH